MDNKTIDFIHTPSDGRIVNVRPPADGATDLQSPTL